MLSKLAIPMTLALLITAGLLRGKHADASIADGYHSEIMEVVDRIPLDVDGWVGDEVPLPPAAINLLRPNALVARQYVHEQREIRATLLVVQCRDIRDMAGHYPPVCYPAHGWTRIEPTIGIQTIHGQLMKPYQFVRDMDNTTHTLTVYNLFALPTGETSVSMEKVRKVGSDYQYRPYGAAQIQVVLGEGTAPQDHQWVLEQMYSIARPTVEAVVQIHAQRSKGQPQ